MTAAPHTEKPKGSARIFRNFGSLTAGKILGDVFLFFLFVVLSRAFGQEGVGQYSFAMALTGFFMVVADFGLEFLTIKEMSRYTGRLGEYYGSIFMLRLIQAAGASALLLLLLLALPLPYDTKVIVALVGVYQFTYKIMDGFAAVFVAREEMHTAALLTSSLRIVAALLAIGVILLGGGLVIALVVLPVIGCIQVILGYIIVDRRHGPMQLTLSWQYVRDTMSRAVPYALSEFLRQLSTRTDVVLLGFILGASAAGVYNAAYRVIFLLIFLPYFGAMSIFPIASKLYLSAREEFAALYHKALNISILAGVPASFGLWLIAPELITLIFGETFAESIGILRWLAWLLLTFCLKFVMQIFLMACDRQNEMTASQWIAAGIGMVLMVGMIYWRGPEGAAIATLCAEAVLVVLYAIQLRPLLGWPQVRLRLIISAVATASFCLPLVLLHAQSMVLIIPTAIVFYTTTLFLFKEIRRNELQALMCLLRR
jgi:O-antigen/teichoic acid export membrane protein